MKGDKNLQDRVLIFLYSSSSILMLFYYLASLQNDSMVTSQCMQFTFGDKGEVYLLDESALPVNVKERRREGKRSMGRRMKNGHANLKSFFPHTNGRFCVFNSPVPKNKLHAL